MDPLDALLWSNPAFVDAIYQDYLRDSASVDSSWAKFFSRAESPEPVGAQPPPFLTTSGGLPDGLDPNDMEPGVQIYDLIHTYREYGHMIARVDPLNRGPSEHPFLDIGEFGFHESDLDREVSCSGFHGAASGPVREFIAILRETYCGPIGVEYMDLMNKSERDWLQERMEPFRNRPRFDRDKKRALLRNLMAADGFEENLQRMYPGAKRFSLEGATTLITLLQEMVDGALSIQLDTMVIGMAHRGRLNVLAHVMGKPLNQLLAEFEGRPLAGELEGYGDVKYHNGYSSDVAGPESKLHLSMAFNPSHLEIVNPVVEGTVRAKQNQIDDHERERVIPVLLHGDAAFAGQGVVAETFTLGRLDGYCTGGTVHIIVNNQVGFTADPSESRSTRYASDIAKTVRAPVFHVNADHPEAVAKVAQLALGYRQKFHHDVVIDLICFRRHGHNEMDDASFTQPVMAKLISKHPPVSEIYGGKLTMAGVVTTAEIDEMRAEMRARMEQARETGKSMSEQVMQTLGGRWEGIKPPNAKQPAPNTAVDRERLGAIATAISRWPEGLAIHKRLARQMKKRAAGVLEGENIDWGAGEALAIGSLLLDGTPVRLSGQDSARGTFSHRHAVYVDQKTGDRYTPLNHIADEQAKLEVINSPLSEEAVLGFEYGYSSADPWSLVIWEAQFGDFANGAQVVIDQFIASGEYKWGRMSGLTMLLPHGYAGQGPEHSSARLERFLALCAENNMQVCNLTTPAQLFHLLRRQMMRSFRRPLVIMSPKSLLRHPAAVSTIADFTDGQFALTIDDPTVTDRSAIHRALLCSGKIYYALSATKAESDTHTDVAVIRIEQLYPFPRHQVRDILRSYPNLRSVFWVQEEPRNMGAWRNLRHQFERAVPEGISLDYAGRDSRAVTASGALDVHRREEAQLIDAAFDRESRPRVVRRKS